MICAIERRRKLRLCRSRRAYDANEMDGTLRSGCGSMRDSSLLWLGSEAIPPEIRPQGFLQVFSDLFAVKAAVFDENFVGPRSRHDHPRNINSRNIALQRDRIANRAALLLRQFNPHAAQKIVVRMVANQGEHEVILQADRAARRIDKNVVDADFLHRTVEVSLDLPILDAVFNVGLDPVFNMMVELPVAVDQCDTGSVPP